MNVYKTLVLVLGMLCCPAMHAAIADRVKISARAIERADTTVLFEGAAMPKFAGRMARSFLKQLKAEDFFQHHLMPMLVTVTNTSDKPVVVRCAPEYLHELSPGQIFFRGVRSADADASLGMKISGYSLAAFGLLVGLAGLAQGDQVVQLAGIFYGGMGAMFLGFGALTSPSHERNERIEAILHQRKQGAQIKEDGDPKIMVAADLAYRIEQNSFCAGSITVPANSTVQKYIFVAGNAAKRSIGLQIASEDNQDKSVQMIEVPAFVVAPQQTTPQS